MNSLSTVDVFPLHLYLSQGALPVSGRVEKVSTGRTGILRGHGHAKMQFFTRAYKTTLSTRLPTLLMDGPREPVDQLLRESFPGSAITA